MKSLQLAFVGWCVALSACVIEQSYQKPPPPTPVPDIAENREVYNQDRLEMLTVHLTVTDLAGLDAVNNNVDGAKVMVAFQSDDYPSDGTPNGTLELRGSSSRESNLHSYKVKLSGDAWHGMTKLNFVKHPYDLTRIRNRLSFEYMRSIPNFTSLRTQFVHVFMNGEDIGLFENVENPSKTFLTAHGLPQGELYKANNFAFLDLTDAQKADPNQLALVLESKAVDATDNHAKLDEMIKHVNDPWVDTDYVFARHFNLDNYMTWLAVEILMGNFDTANQNFMIFSPPDTDGWYFLPWDYDGSWGFNGPDGQPGTQPRAQSRLGVGTWWLSPLHKRFFSDPKNVALLEAKMDQLMATVMSDEKTQAMLASYHDLVASVVTQAPDVDHLPDNSAPDRTASIAAWETEYARLGTQLGRNYEDYYKQKDVPMPIFQAAPIVSSDQIVYQWDTSYSLVGDSLTYDVEVSKTPAFAPGDIVMSKTGLTNTTYIGSSLPSGQYYWRVRVRDARAGTWQESAELYLDGQGNKYPGVMTLTI